MSRNVLLVLFAAVMATICRAQETGPAVKEPRAELPMTGDGWLDVAKLVVPSDGTRVPAAQGGAARDRGSRIAYFDPEKGDNAAADVYWWDGRRIVDSAGRPADAEGRAYGTDPLQPNEASVKPFAHVAADERFGDSTGFPDWFLLRRGREHASFDGNLSGGRSESEPLVVAAYGPRADGRAFIRPQGRGPFGARVGRDGVAHLHQVLSGLDVEGTKISYGRMHDACTSPGAPGIPTLYMEDCKMVHAQMNYLPLGTTVRRCVSAYNWSARSHSQGYFTNGVDAAATFDEVIFYKNGFKEDPRIHADPRRKIFDRNIYQGGGGQMGHVYRNIISADGGSGGPQMRLGGLIENSLIIEGYWFSATASGNRTNTWLTEGKQTGRSALVRNNVQFVHKYPSPADPDTAGRSQVNAQPGMGYMLGGASFGVVVEGNIISGAMGVQDLGFGDRFGRVAFRIRPNRTEYQDGNVYTQRNNVMRGNIAYLTRNAINMGEDWTGVTGNIVEDNVFAAAQGVGEVGENIETADQLIVRNNRFYVDEGGLPDAPWMGEGNTEAPLADAKESENWPDPDRTLKRYVTEVLKLELLDWSDDPWLPAEEVAPRVEAGEAYDPTGLKTFMAVATNMRRDGAEAIPDSGKPSWTGDYPWDGRFTGQAVVNWIRAGFGMQPLPTAGDRQEKAIE